MMKKPIILMILMVFLVVSGGFSQEIGFSYNPNTGDKQLDLALGNLNVQAGGDKENFINRLCVSYNVKKEEIEPLVYKSVMPPGDVYMTVKVSKIMDLPVNKVVDAYNAHKQKGWGFIARQLGVKPGSKEFHALKQDDTGILGTDKKSKKSKEKKPKSRGKKQY